MGDWSYSRLLVKWIWELDEVGAGQRATGQVGTGQIRGWSKRRLVKKGLVKQECRQKHDAGQTCCQLTRPAAAHAVARVLRWRGRRCVRVRVCVCGGGCRS
eukprot:1272175-Rhodomonas_salina.1